MKIALAQTKIVSEDKEANKATAKKMTAKAAASGCDIIIFPEVSLTGFSLKMDRLAEPFENSETIEFFRSLAAENGIYIMFSAALTQDSSMYNYAVVADNLGNIISRYAKVHPYSHGVEAKFFSAGESPEWFSLKGITASPLLCYDTRFPEIFQIVSQKSRLIVICACWPAIRIPSYEVLLKARAIENQSFIAVANRVGQEMKYFYNGHSQIIDPYGRVLTEICENEALITADIDISEADECRRSFNVKKDRRPDFYKKWL